MKKTNTIMGNNLPEMETLLIERRITLEKLQKKLIKHSSTDSYKSFRALELLVVYNQKIIKKMERIKWLS